MVSSPQGIIIEYAAHAIYLPVGYAILRLAGTANPKIRALPSRANLKLFLLLSLIFIFIELNASLPGGHGISIFAAFGGPLFLALQLFFEGVFVGWTEEYLFRGCIQRVLNRRLKSLIGSRIKSGTVLAALIFGVFHFVNLALGQSLLATIPQVIFATFFGLVVGWFYDRSNDFAGIAWIHNITDLAGAVLPFFV